MRKQVIEYLHRNWGAPLIVAFIVAMLASIYGPLSPGSQSFGSAPPTVAVVAISCFFIGVVLQIVSYVVYRKK